MLPTSGQLRAEAATNAATDNEHRYARTFHIYIKGARVHNLKNIEVEIPHDELVVVTGLSGSGRVDAGLRHDLRRGQRRYVESLSAYARQFLGKVDKPDVDIITGIAPAIAIEQKVNTRNPALDGQHHDRNDSGGARATPTARATASSSRRRARPAIRRASRPTASASNPRPSICSASTIRWGPVPAARATARWSASTRTW